MRFDTQLFSRRDLLARLARLSGAAGLAASGCGAALAQFRVEISGVGATQVPIALLRFRDEEKSPVAVSAVVRADLERSGLFSFVESARTGLDDTSRPAMPDWRAVNVDALSAGSITRLADGRFDVRYRLWDVLKGGELAAQSIAVPPGDLRLAAHRIADEIYEKLIGEPGVFSSRIAYVSKAAGRHTLWVADADGEQAQVAVAGPEPIISPAWSPDSRELAYVSFETKKAVVYVQDILSGKRRVVANFRGSNSAPAWSPDASQLVVTLTRDGSSQLYTMSRSGDNLRRLTNSNAIDTEAAWSADGQFIYFVSDRGGGPQIYRVPAAGGNAERVSFQGSYNISPALSADGRYMAYISRAGNSFRLMLQELANGTSIALTDTNDDESPSFSPNSRLVIYASRSGGRDVLMTTNLTGRIKTRLAIPQADVREPVWGPKLR
jgi:TolB protein